MRREWREVDGEHQLHRVEPWPGPDPHAFARMVDHVRRQADAQGFDIEVDGTTIRLVLRQLPVFTVTIAVDRS